MEMARYIYSILKSQLIDVVDNFVEKTDDYEKRVKAEYSLV